MRGAGTTTGAAAALALLLVGASASAQTPPAVAIECDALDANAHAALEARARAELAAGGVSSGSLRVTCEAEVVRVSFDRDGASPAVRAVPAPTEQAAIVDVALEAIDGVIADASPKRSPVLASAPSKVVASPPEDGPAPRVEPTKRSTSLWLAAGADAELWANDAVGAAGPYFAWRFTSGLVAFEAEGALRFGLATPSRFSLTLVEALAGVDVSLPMARAVSFGAGLGATWVHASAPAGSTPPTQSSVAPSARLRARYRLELGVFDVHAGPELYVLARPQAIDDHGMEVARVPQLSFGLAVDVGARVIR